MRNKFTVIGFLLLIAYQSSAQTGTIKGVIINSKTYERLPFASAYINYTTLGTSANERGEFILKNVPVGQHDLVVTFVGHHHSQIKIVVKDTTTISLTIRLKSKELREIKVYSKKDKNWERQYEKFKKLFLGNSIHAARCEILNPWVLDFEWNNKGFFTATASDVLQIENFSLGYKLYYQMKNFKVGSSDYLIGGNVRFQLMETFDSATMDQWVKNRYDVYLGSSRQFFRSVFERTLRKEGFELFKDDTGAEDIIRMANFLANIGKELSSYDIEDLHQEEVQPNQYKIQVPERLEVHYLSKADNPRIYHNVTHAVSWIEANDNFLLINSDGVVLNPDQLFLSGNMSEARVAELLPYDFHPPKASVLIKYQPATAKLPVNALSYLLEKPYLHTDKSYYYPNENVWFKGYINYGANVFRDSLSQVLYVDVIDSAQNNVLTKIFQIDKGFAEGNLIIPPSLGGGDYTLRAYTHWILNFDAALIFTKPIKILEYSESGKTTMSYVPVDTLNGMTITLEKDTFQTREKINITVGVKDFIENYMPASFSISVTDFQQVVPASNETNILADFAIPKISLPDSLPKQVEHPIQYGINFSGRFVTKKGKPSQGLLTVARENTAQIFTITTEENGKFSFANLKLYDSAKLSILAKTVTGKIGKVILDSTRVSPRTPRVNPLKIETYKADNPSRYNSSNQFLKAHILDEVTINETRLESRGTKAIGTPDHVFTGELLRSLNNTDVLMALQSRVAGLRAVGGFLRLGPPTTFNVQNSSDAEPLVLIDGIPVNGASDAYSESTSSLISNLSTHEIERIEVYKYSSSAAYGSRGANGVISITTRKSIGNYQRFGERGRFEEIKINGFASVKKFTSPNYAIANDNQSRPDYRSTIYWNSNVATDENNLAQVSFYAADLPTQYRIVIEGITKDGKVVHGEKLITVVEKP